jgi:hypothetical protein
VHVLGASPSRGLLASLGPTEVAWTTDAGERRAPLERLRALRFVESAESPFADLPHWRARLVGGEVILGAYERADASGIALRTPELGTVSLPFESLRHLVAVPAFAGPCHEPEQARDGIGDADRAWLSSGDEYAGILLSADDEGLVFETARGAERRISWKDLSVLSLTNQALTREEADVAVEVETAAGARLALAGPPTLEGESLVVRLRSAPGEERRVPLAAVRAVRTSGGAFVYASDLPFTSTFTSPYGPDETAALLDHFYAARADRRRKTGCPLRMGGETYRHGFAVHARSEIRISLGGRFATFESLVGIDDDAIDPNGVPGGDVDVRVLADGEVRWSREGVKGGEPPSRTGPIDVGGVDELVLVVDFGQGLHVLDHGTWGDPVLTRR